MANDRPSARPGGYWLASTPASAPSHAYPDWLLDILGQGIDAPSDSIPDAPGIWSQPTGEGLPAWERQNGTYEANALSGFLPRRRPPTTGSIGNILALLRGS